MYYKILVMFIIVNIDISVDFKVSVKQGDSMSPVIFLFLMVAFSETLEDKWTALVLIKSQFAHKYNSPRSTGQLVSHQPGTFFSGTLFDLFCMLYVYDGSFVFESRADIERGIALLSGHFAWFGPKIHISTGKIPQRLNAYYF